VYQKFAAVTAVTKTPYQKFSFSSTLGDTIYRGKKIISCIVKSDRTKKKIIKEVFIFQKKEYLINNIFQVRLKLVTFRVFSLY